MHSKHVRHVALAYYGKWIDVPVRNKIWVSVVPCQVVQSWTTVSDRYSFGISIGRYIGLVDMENLIGIRYRVSVIGYWLSAIGYRLSADKKIHIGSLPI